ncbi:hypothetical protein NESM_000261200 [Novymonas esmeraldas]|uniref:Uncharacterized protein n=1 Tax=Novymonas esmeraldas TaxID=1808958 RepID=A0AAW0F977_9TRYP
MSRQWTPNPTACQAGYVGQMPRTVPASSAQGIPLAFGTGGAHAGVYTAPPPQTGGRNYGAEAVSPTYYEDERYTSSAPGQYARGHETAGPYSNAVRAGDMPHFYPAMNANPTVSAQPSDGACPYYEDRTDRRGRVRRCLGRCKQRREDIIERRADRRKRRGGPLVTLVGRFADLAVDIHKRTQGSKQE